MKHMLLVFTLFLCLGMKSQIKKELFESYKLQEKRDISYYLPEDYTDKKKYSIILVLDAEYLFDLVVSTSKFYSKFHRMPQFIVVGIHQSKENQRFKDCAFDKGSGMLEPKAYQFLEFLELELIPHVEKTYPTTPFKMIFGYDITANFVNYSLFKEASLFNSFVSISPTLAPEMETRVPESLNAMEKAIFYHLIVDGEIAQNDKQIMELNSALQEIKNDTLNYFFDDYSVADHISVPTYSIGKVFDAIFAPFKPITPEEYKNQILTSTEPVYTYLSNKYTNIEKIFSFPATVHLNDIIAIYSACKKKEDFESLQPLSELCKQEFPQTMLGFYFEGEYYEQIGDPKKAMRAFGKTFGLQEVDFLTQDMAYDKINALKKDFGY